MDEFIKKTRKAFQQATGQIGNDEIASRYAIAYQLERIGDLLQDYIAEEFEGEDTDSEDSNNEPA